MLHDACKINKYKFQSTLPRRERLRMSCSFTNRLKFQSTLPRRERRSRYSDLCGSLYFNPRSREGSDVYGFEVVYMMDISIHAPAKGATRFARNTGANLFISIHAPAKGATTL